MNAHATSTPLGDDIESTVVEELVFLFTFFHLFFTRFFLTFSPPEFSENILILKTMMKFAPPPPFLFSLLTFIPDISYFAWIYKRVDWPPSRRSRGCRGKWGRKEQGNEGEEFPFFFFFFFLILVFSHLTGSFLLLSNQK